LNGNPVYCDGEKYYVWIKIENVVATVDAEAMLGVAFDHVPLCSFNRAGRSRFPSTESLSGPL